MHAYNKVNVNGAKRIKKVFIINIITNDKT